MAPILRGAKTLAFATHPIDLLMGAIEDAVAASQHGPVAAEGPPGEAESRREILVARIDQRGRQAGLLGGLHISRIGERGAGRAGKRGDYFLVHVGKKIGPAVVAVMDGIQQLFVAQTQVERQAARYLPVVLEKLLDPHRQIVT